MSYAIWPTDPDSADPFPEPVDAQAHPLGLALAALWDGRRTEASIRDSFSLAESAGPGLPPRAGPWLPNEADLARITADSDPAAGASAPDLVLGPAADHADRRSLIVAMALAVFFRGDGVSDTPLKRWLRSKPRPSVKEREAVRAVARAPFAPWRVVSLPAPDEVVLADAVGLWDPGRVRLRAPGVPFSPLKEGDHLLARVALGPNGWVATCPIAVPGPLPDAVPRWIRWLVWADQVGVHGRPPTLAGTLARRGHQLARRILEQAWAR